MKLLIYPEETFFFRDAKPFDKGEGWASGIFPPLPSTIYGAFRTAAISQKSNVKDYYENNCPITEEMGSPAHYGSFRIRSFLLCEPGMGWSLVPMPKDIVEDKQKKRLVALQRMASPVVTDTEFALYQSPDPTFEEPAIPWLDHYGLMAYLTGVGPMEPLSSPPLRQERKTGIQRDRITKSAQEHMLYVQEMLRLNDGIGFCVEIENASCLETKGIIKLGHDGRVFSYTRLEGGNYDYLNPARPLIMKSIEKTKRFKLLFTSPVLLQNGWLPGGVDQSNGFQWKIDGLSLRIDSVIIGRHMRIGGWKIGKQSGVPKPMQRALPPGSAFYCTLINGDMEQLFKTFFDNNYADIDPDMAKQGFGHTLIGIQCD